jgi:hypothetical protein
VAEVYADKVAKLELARNDPIIRDEAGDLTRSLISEITLRPREDESGVDAILHGDLATILAFCDAGEHKSKLPGAHASGSSLSVVAGTRNTLALHAQETLVAGARNTLALLFRAPNIGAGQTSELTPRINKKISGSSASAGQPRAGSNAGAAIEPAPT